MSDRPTIKPAENGPYLVSGCGTLKSLADGTVHASDGTVALCRCGESKNKPFCDGSHVAAGFSGAKEADRVPDRLETHVGEAITVHDNRGACAHAGYCTSGLASVFRQREEPFVDPDGAGPDEITATVQQCPSGALSLSRDGAEVPPVDEAREIWVVPNGPYAVRGGADLQDAELPQGVKPSGRFTLCRCGKSKNKPFCNGAHWYHRFDEHAPEPEG